MVQRIVRYERRRGSVAIFARGAAVVVALVVMDHVRSDESVHLDWIAHVLFLFFFSDVTSRITFGEVFFRFRTKQELIRMKLDVIFTT